MRLVLAAAAVVLAACQSTPAPPSGKTVALRVEVIGGGPLRPGTVTFPEFVLYGDRTLIRADGDVPVEHHLTREEFDRIYDRARSAGLETARTFDEQAPDAPVLEVVFGFDGGRSVTRITAPDRESPGEAGEVTRAVVVDPERDLSSPHQPYAPERVAVVAGTSSGAAEGPEWPLEPLAEGVALNGGRCAVYDAAQVHEIRSDTTWTSRGVAYRVQVRPLLPDEADCAALTHQP
ncbi:hypothetical protein [Saccharothrix syringae]|uniref:Uncharacterized protein n=1 Tax=Saccharothrix syringae TaxID=103733 RepID=A0A5Q0GXK3_SACSY|nr:hypothetical protein [Saccharothrix syringae]QFZ18698.1 hypothetical protein EKG83_15620 [Saccharothrix syringae]